MDLWRGSKEGMEGNGMVILDMAETIRGRLERWRICDRRIGIERDAVFDV